MVLQPTREVENNVTLLWCVREKESTQQQQQQTHDKVVVVVESNIGGGESRSGLTDYEMTSAVPYGCDVTCSAATLLYRCLQVSTGVVGVGVGSKCEQLGCQVRLTSLLEVSPGACVGVYACLL